jgi:hypothetical protein
MVTAPISAHLTRYNLWHIHFAMAQPSKPPTMRLAVLTNSPRFPNLIRAFMIRLWLWAFIVSGGA